MITVNLVHKYSVLIEQGVLFHIFFRFSVFYPPVSQPQLKTTVNQAPQREKKTLAIVDPSTGKNILDDMNNEKPDRTPTPPQSSESSARNTPAPVSLKYTYI